MNYWELAINEKFFKDFPEYKKKIQEQIDRGLLEIPYKISDCFVIELGSKALYNFEDCKYLIIPLMI